MPSLFIHAAIITLVLILTPLPTLTDFVLDTNGEALLNGGDYYIIPSNGYASALTLTPKTKASPCPLYIALNKCNFHGLLLTISSPSKILYIPLSVDVNFVFESNITTCMGPLEWQVTTDATNDRMYVVTGGGMSTSIGTNWFAIESYPGAFGTEKFVYKMKYCSSVEGEDVCNDIGFFRENRLLGVTNEKPLIVKFEKVALVN